MKTQLRTTKSKTGKKDWFWPALRFVAGIGLISALTWTLLSVTPLQGVLAGYTAYATAGLLATLGQHVDVLFQAFPHLISNRFDAELVPLCFGTLELALWTGMILSTENRTLKRRWTGLAMGITAFLIFNPIRIALTLYVFDASQPFTSAIVHDVLFRISLICLFVVAYAIWYQWPQKKPQP